MFSPRVMLDVLQLIANIILVVEEDAGNVQVTNVSLKRMHFSFNPSDVLKVYMLFDLKILDLGASLLPSPNQCFTLQTLGKELFILLFRLSRKMLEYCD